MYPKVSFSGFFLTSLAITVVILFSFDYSPLFADNFSGKSNGSGSSSSSSLAAGVALALNDVISNRSSTEALATRTSHISSELPRSLVAARDGEDEGKARDRFQLWATPSALERERLNRTESGVPIQVEDPQHSSRGQKWYHACMKRSPYNDTFIKLVIGYSSQHPTLAIEEDRKATVASAMQREKLLLRGSRLKRGAKRAQQEAQRLLEQLGAGEQADDDDGSSYQLEEAAAPFQPSFARSRGQQAANDDSSGGKKAASSERRPIGPAGSSFRRARAAAAADSASSASSSSLQLSSAEIAELKEKTLSFGRKRLAKRSLARIDSGSRRNYYDNIDRLALFTPAGQRGLLSEPINQAVAAVLGRIGANATQELKQAIDKIFVSDVRISWSINCALNNVRSVKKTLDPLIRLLDSEIQNNRSKLGGDETIKQLSENRRKWMANFEDLEVKNGAQMAENSSNSGSGGNSLLPTAPVRVVETRHLFANVSHYMQFVAVALEQMIYEQAVWDRQFSITYNDLERATLKMLCEIDTLCQLLDNLREGKETLLRLMETHKLTDEDLRAFDLMRKINASSADSIGKRVSYSGDLLDSAYFRWLKANEKQIQEQQLLISDNTKPQQASDNRNPVLATKQAPAGWTVASLVASSSELVAPSFVGISRSVMPVQERSLKSYAERLVRDKSMFENYEKVLSYYERILINIFV